MNKNEADTWYRDWQSQRGINDQTGSFLLKDLPPKGLEREIFLLEHHLKVYDRFWLDYIYEPQKELECLRNSQTEVSLLELRRRERWHKAYASSEFLYNWLKETKELYELKKQRDAEIEKNKKG